MDKEEHTNDLNSQEEEKIKIPFYKRIWYAISKPSKYLELINDGVIVTIKYLFLLVFICSAIYSISASILTDKLYSQGYSYLEENLPNATYSEGVLTSDNEEIVILENDFVTGMLGGNVIIAVNITDEEVINGYLESFGEDIGYVLVSEKIKVANLEEEYSEYTYKEFTEKFFGEEITFFSTDTLLAEIQSYNIGITSIYLQTIIVTWISYFLLFQIYALIITIFIFIISKIMKLGYTFKNIFEISIYGLTLSVIITFIYAIQYMFTGFSFAYFNSIIIAIATMYAASVVYDKKIKEKQNKVK